MFRQGHSTYSRYCGIYKVTRITSATQFPTNKKTLQLDCESDARFDNPFLN